MYYTSTIDTPVGMLMAIASDEYLVMLEFADSKNLQRKLGIFGLAGTEEGTWQKGGPILEKTKKELSEYFAGTRKDFDIPIAPEGTDFQKTAWKALERIPYGETRSYKEEAILAGNPKAVRAIGGANNKNPIVIIIPCHRVIGADGSLIGYGGGVDRKVWLLHHEQI